MRKPLVAGNWKMHMTVDQARRLIFEMVTDLQAVTEVDRVVCPPYTALAAVAELLRDTDIGVGGQNMHWEKSGAYTGEISASMLQEFCTYVILGHSERRAEFAETDEQVNRKIAAAIEQRLKPILCIGETLAENEADQTAEVVTRQLEQGLAGISLSQEDELIIAYEPVWAIGTGRAATPAGANRVIQDVIRPVLATQLGPEQAENIRILYGGSVKPENAASFFTQSDVDGALVGGASLKARDFVQIVRAAVPG